ncbi:MAG: SPASM domain-containing protein, partial [Dictyoglomus turgidum]
FGERLYVIVVVSKINKPYVEEIIDIGEHLGLNLKLNPLFSAGRATEFFNTVGLTAEEYGEVLVRAYRQWSKYKPSGMIFEQGKEYEDYVRGIDIKPLLKCPYSGSCTGYIWGISPRGEIYNCLTSMYFGKYLLGNYITGINEQSFREAQMHSLPDPECLTCGICGGGCKLFRTQEGKSLWCLSYKMLYSEIKERIP